MTPEIVIALISGLATVLSVVLTNRQSGRAIDAKLEKAQAVTDTRLSELTREVREHNDFARRVPVLEEQIRTVNRRIDELYRGESTK